MGSAGADGEAMRAAGGSIDVEINGRRLWADIRSSAARARAPSLYWRLRPLRPDVIESILKQIEVQLGIETVDRNTHRWMNNEELRALSATTGVDVGAHTLRIRSSPRSHPMNRGRRSMGVAISSNGCSRRV